MAAYRKVTASCMCLGLVWGKHVHRPEDMAGMLITWRGTMCRGPFIGTAGVYFKVCVQVPWLHGKTPSPSSSCSPGLLTVRPAQ